VARDSAAAMDQGWPTTVSASGWRTTVPTGNSSAAALSGSTVDGRDCLEIGWAVRQQFWGRGYATEIGQAGPSYAFEVLAAQEVLSYTEIHNRQSRAVMERRGMQHERDITPPGLVAGLHGIQDAAPFALCGVPRSATSQDVAYLRPILGGGQQPSADPQVDPRWDRLDRRQGADRPQSRRRSSSPSTPASRRIPAIVPRLNSR
jgi:hypothetical protein